jgi:hypothetical protein
MMLVTTVNCGAPGGGPHAKILVDLVDPDRDGKVRPSEIDERSKLGVLHIFEASGEISVLLRLVLEHPVPYPPFIDKTPWNVAEQRLWTFGANKPAPEAPKLAEFVPGEDGLLQINMGPKSGARLHGDLTDGDESFVIGHIATQKTKDPYRT